MYKAKAKRNTLKVDLRQTNDIIEHCSSLITSHVNIIELFNVGTWKNGFIATFFCLAARRLCSASLAFVSLVCFSRTSTHIVSLDQFISAFHRHRALHNSRFVQGVHIRTNLSVFFSQILDSIFPFCVFLCVDRQIKCAKKESERLHLWNCGRSVPSIRLMSFFVCSIGPGIVAMFPHSNRIGKRLPPHTTTHIVRLHIRIYTVDRRDLVAHNKLCEFRLE